jgi:hypothetical protein
VRLPRVSAKRLRNGRIRITATRGALTTEGTFTEAEARQLHAQLGALLAPSDPWIPADPDGLPPRAFPFWRAQEIQRRAEAIRAG